ncbi:hypothetical protein FK220_012585 [Flavobacteriaceae bacterium TP-CH-4]|uniref:Calcineurin-like phosphoesterase domain-containing protein n=1 Tax=Pelagihabitans pacificus TaxID=2696054 RepID=A0A967E7F0_9FLAO|nr:metallophosphoesterase [Pelagihabitans pacificus]NHF60184.1 hypothetical protein [Pelagihabitans pacificus]
MKKRILRYFKHIFGTLLILLIAALYILIAEDGGIHYGDNDLKMNWDNEGPYVFYENDSIVSVQYIKGNQKEGFYVNKEKYSSTTAIPLACYFALDDTSFKFSIDNRSIETPKATYQDDEKILAISDIESGFKSFRDFLIHSQVIDEQLQWTFGKGHLVLVGDFVDRGFSTTQVLWFIYKLEQDAKNQGGMVHFILGNHEIKNLQGNHEAASLKYNYVSAILGKQQYDLYGGNSFLGRWLESKNTIERINGHLFVHGGIHPDVANANVTIEDVNKIVRANYRNPFYPKREKSTEQLLISTFKGPSWYRGYFKEDITLDEVEKGLDNFNAKDVIVGHTIQKKITKQFEGKVLGIDVQHPKDYHKNWPNRKSEGLLIENETYYRVFDDGERKKI